MSLRTLFSLKQDRGSWIAIGAILVFIAAVAMLVWFARITLIEPDALAHACFAGMKSWRCTVRDGLVFGFTRNVFGIVSLIAAFLAIVSRWRAAALVAIVSGVAGALLYRFELAGMGLLLGALVIARESCCRTAERVQDGERG